MPEEAVLDAPAVDTTPVETAPEPTEAPAAETQPTTETQPNETIDPDLEGDGRTVPAAIRQHLAQLKTQNPGLAKQLKGILFADQALKREFPGGVKEALEVKQTLAKYGGPEALQEIQSEREAWSKLDESFINADPSFVDTIAENNPDSFAKLAPSVISKFAEIDPETYQHVMGKVVFNTLSNAPLNDIYQALAGNEQTKALAGKLAEWYNGIHDLASKAPEKKIDPEREKLQKEREAFEEEKGKAFQAEAAREIVGTRDSIITRELNKLLNGKKVPDEKMQAVKLEVIRRMGALLRSQDGFQAAHDRFLSARDKAGLLGFIKPRLDQVIPKAADQAYKLFFAGESKPVVKPATQPSTQKAAVDPGFTRVSVAPNPADVDHKQTPFEMKWKKQAVLKDGRKVTWA